MFSNLNTGLTIRHSMYYYESMRLIYLFMLLGWSSTVSAQERLEFLAKTFPASYKTLFRNVTSNELNPSYEFDAQREPEQALEEGLGGHCNTHARVAAYTLMKNGVPAKDLRIVSSISDRSLDALCKGRKDSAATAGRDGLSGHVFLLMRSEKQWYLVNTTTVPGTPPAKPFGKLGLEFTPFVGPEELEREMKKGPVPLPTAVTQSLPPVFGPMTIFHAIRPDKYPVHDFAGRRKLVASGSLESEICRYDGSAAAAMRTSLEPNH